jgi:hypothetical protein
MLITGTAFAAVPAGVHPVSTTIKIAQPDTTILASGSRKTGTIAGSRSALGGGRSILGL